MNPLLNFINKIPRIHYPEKVRTEFIVEGVKTLTKKTTFFIKDISFPYHFISSKISFQVKNK